MAALLLTQKEKQTNKQKTSEWNRPRSRYSIYLYSHDGAFQMESPSYILRRRLNGSPQNLSLKRKTTKIQMPVVARQHEKWEGFAPGQLRGCEVWDRPGPPTARLPSMDRSVCAAEPALPEDLLCSPCTEHLTTRVVAHRPMRKRSETGSTRDPA